MKVLVATYEHKHGSDIRVFLTRELAEQWRQKLAEEYWEDLFDPDTMPEDRKAAADMYFEVGAERCYGESFTVEECEVEGLEGVCITLESIIEGIKEEPL